MWLHLLKKEILNRKLHFLPNESRLTCRSSDITKHSHTAAHCVLQILHSSWSLFPQQVTYIEKILRKWYASAPLPPLPIQPNNLFSGKLLNPSTISFILRFQKVITPSNVYSYKEEICSFSWFSVFVHSIFEVRKIFTGKDLFCLLNCVFSNLHY